jgi:hypothetical protein
LRVLRGLFSILDRPIKILGIIRFILLNPLRLSQFNTNKNNQLYYKVTKLKAANVISEDYIRRGIEKGIEENGIDSSKDG